LKAQVYVLIGLIQSTLEISFKSTTLSIQRNSSNKTLPCSPTHFEKIMKKDKVKILDEVLSEERIQSFLEWQAPEGENPDFHCLEKAYRGMPPQYFKVFLKHFTADNRDLNAHSKAGESLMQILQNHKQAQPYIELLRSAGAQ